MDNKNTITIVSVTDNHFIVLLAAMLKSLEMNHKSDDKIELYLVEEKVTSKNKGKINQTIKSKDIKIYWLSIDTVVDKKKLPLDSSSFPLNVYIRLFIPYFLPKEIKKVIYLDVDMIVKNDISNLWQIDLGDKIIGGVVDRSEVVSCYWAGIRNYKELGIRPQAKYYNSGLLMINTEEWRERRIPESIIKCINENKRFCNFPDQYGLNVVFADKWHEIDAKWNTYSISDESNPFIIHFTGRKPIYSAYNFNENYKNDFYKYLSLTPWKNFQPLSESNRNIKKAYNKIIKKIFSFFSYS